MSERTTALLLAPLKGALFCLFLPFIGFALLGIVVAQRVRRAFHAR